LQTSFHAAYEGAIDTHPFSDSFLAQSKSQPKLACVCSKYLANIHPQDRKESRILTLRVIIRGSGPDRPPASGLRLNRAGGADQNGTKVSLVDHFC
jgi:hypothetical protein